MPHLVWSDYSSRDMRRHYDFLAEKDPKAAARAMKTIRQSLRGLLRAPLMGRPADDQMRAHRELVIQFGQSS